MPTVWPSGSISESNLDQGTDSRALARADLLQAVQQLNLIRAARGLAGGIPELDDSGLIPVTQIPVQAVLGLMQFVDGAGSGLDADRLDGYEATSFVLTDGSQDVNTPSSLATGLVIRHRTATTNARARAATLRNTNSPAATAAGYGVELRAELGNAAGTTVSAGFLGWDWTDPTNASEDAALVAGHMVAGTLTEAFRWVDRKLQVAEQSGTPSGTPPTGSWWLYFKAGGLAVMDDAGVEALVTSGGATDHATLLNLTSGDPHTQYFRPDGARAMTADLPLAAFSVLSTDLGADPAAPAAGQVKWYTKGGQLYYRNSTGVVGPIIAGGVTDHGALTGLADDDHTQYLLRQPTANVAINDAGDDLDFRIEGNTAANLFTLDAGNDAIGINVAPGATYRLELTAGTGRAGLGITGDDQTGLVVTTVAGTAITAAGSAALFSGSRNVASPPAVAALAITEAGTAGFRLLDLDGLTGTDLLRARVGSIDALKLLAAECVVNDGGDDYDFRVEGDTAPNLLVVDASADTVGINTTLTTGRLNIEGGSKAGLYALTTNVSKAAIVAESQASGAYAIETINTSGNGRGLKCQSIRDPAALFAKDLQGFAPSIYPYAVLMEVVDATDAAGVLGLKQSGAGDFLACYTDADTWFRFPVTGGAYWKYLAGDMATPPAGMWGIFPKVDGWYQISPDGDVTQLGSGGGSIISEFGAEFEVDHLEELVTLSSGATVSSTIQFPAGCIAAAVRTRAVTGVSGGYHCGLAGGGASATRFGASISGTAGQTNDGAAHPAPFSNQTAQSIVFTHPSGTFSGGTVRLTIFFWRIAAPTS